MQITSKYNSLSSVNISDINDTFVKKLLNGKLQARLNNDGLDHIEDLINSILLTIEVLDLRTYQITAKLDTELFTEWKENFRSYFIKGK